MEDNKDYDVSFLREGTLHQCTTASTLRLLEPFKKDEDEINHVAIVDRWFASYANALAVKDHLNIIIIGMVRQAAKIIPWNSFKIGMKKNNEARAGLFKGFTSQYKHDTMAGSVKDMMAVVYIGTD